MSATCEDILVARFQVVVGELREIASAMEPEVRRALEGHLFFLEHMAEGEEVDTDPEGPLVDAHVEQAIRHLEVGAECVPGSSMAACLLAYVPLLRRLVVAS